MLWKKNEKALLKIVLEGNRRQIVLSTRNYLRRDLVGTLLKYFQAKLICMCDEDCQYLYKILDQTNWDYLDISMCDFTQRPSLNGLWHLILIRKLLVKGLDANKIYVDSSFIKDIFTQPQVLVVDHGDLNEKYILEENLKIATTERQLWNLLTMKLSLSLPNIEIDESECSTDRVQFFKDRMKYINYTVEDIDQPLHVCFHNVMEAFPQCEHLTLNWY